MAVKRADYETLAADTGWVVDIRDNTTVFGRNGWRIEASWLDDRNVLARLAVTDPYGQPGESMNWLDDRGEIGEELRQQLESPGPLRDPVLPLSVLVAGYAAVMEATERVHPDYRVPAKAIAARLREFLTDTGQVPDDEPTTGGAEDYARDRWIDEQTGVS